MFPTLEVGQAVMWLLASREPKKASDGKWRLRGELAINPKARCPGCKEWVETGRVWAWRGTRMLGVWDAKTGARIDMWGAHPHVADNGSICLGDNETVAGALWTGAAPGAEHQGVRVEDWFERMGHSCEALEELASGAECDRCRVDVGEYELSWSEEREESLCEDCWDYYYVSCADCGESHWRDSSYQGICPRCYENNYFTCDSCNQVLHTDEYGQDGECQECWDSWHFYCQQCESDCELDDRQPGETRWCKGCWDEAHPECSGCETMTLREELDAHGLCEGCRPYDPWALGGPQTPRSELEALGQATLLVERAADAIVEDIPF